jgi:hypothetical protein
MSMKKSNAGRITRADQAWGPAHREYEERTGVRLSTSPPVPQAGTRPEVIPATQSLVLPLKFITAALLTSGKDDIRYYLNGVYLHAVDGEIRICGTDGHRMIVSRFTPDKDQQLPQWCEAGLILPRTELAQALPILDKNARLHQCDSSDPSVIIDHKPGAETVTLRSINGFASFAMKPVEGKFPDYARILAGNGANLARGEGEAMTAAGINVRYIKGAADVASRLGATAIHSFSSSSESASLYTFEGAPDTVLIIMCMRTGPAVPDGVIKLLGPDAIAASISALKAHATRTAKALTLAKNDKERSDLERRKSGFEERIAHLLEQCGRGPKQLTHQRGATKAQLEHRATVVQAA